VTEDLAEIGERRDGCDDGDAIGELGPRAREERDARAGRRADQSRSTSDIGPCDGRLDHRHGGVERPTRWLAVAEAGEVGNDSDVTRAGEALGKPLHNRLPAAQRVCSSDEDPRRERPFAGRPRDRDRDAVDLLLLDSRIRRQAARSAGETGQIHDDRNQCGRASAGAEACLEIRTGFTRCRDARLHTPKVLPRQPRD
jgi:hypothetical protein